MAKDPSRSLSDKVEETIEGAVRFVVRFLRTTCIILFRPLACERILLAPERGNRRFIRPMSFLAIGGFVFSLTLSVYPKGLLGMVNLIWFDEEVNQAILSRWQEAISVSGLLLAAFPVLISVALTAGLASRLIPDLRQRRQFVVLNGYLFGFQCFLLFSSFFLSLSVEIGKELFGVEVNEILGLEDVRIGEATRNIFYAGLIALFLSALLMPMIGLAHWAVRTLRGQGFLRQAGACIVVVPYCLGVLGILSYSASVPAAFKQVAAPKPRAVEIHFLVDPAVRLAGVGEDGSRSLTFDYRIAIENIDSAAMIVPRNNISAGLVREFDRPATAGAAAPKEQFWFADELRLREGDGDALAIVMPKAGLASYRLAGELRLSAEEWQLVQRKADHSLDTNDYGYFVNIQIRQGSIVTDRRLWLDVDKLAAGQVPTPQAATP